MTRPSNRNHIWVVVLLGILALGLIILLMQPLQTIDAIVREGGPVELASAAGYFICFMLVWTRAGTAPVTKLSISVLMLALLAREQDMDKLHFTRGLFKSSQYLKDDVPFTEKVIGLAIILGLIACAILILIREKQHIWVGWITRHTGFVALGLAILLALISKFYDGIGRKLAPFGIDVSAAMSTRFQGVEESMELAIPAFLVLAILAWPRREIF